jgi:chromosome segregation ATPase
MTLIRQENKPMPSAFEQNLTKIVNDTKTYKAQLAKIPADVKAKDSNYRNALSMIYEAQKAITELKGEIKKGTKNAVDDMKKWQANYPKIFARMKPISDEIAKLKKSLSDFLDDVKDAQKKAEQLNKDAAKSAMTDIKTAAAQLKQVLADLKTIAEGIGKQVQALNDLPKEPNGVFV